MDSTRGVSRRRRHGLIRSSSEPAPRPATPPEAKPSTATAYAEQNETTQATQQVLYTPEEGAQLLRIRSSWLRRKAAARVIPCRFVGKHLRFPAAIWKPSPAWTAASLEVLHRRENGPDQELALCRQQSVHGSCPVTCEEATSRRTRMAFVEKTGKNRWRVRYWRNDGTHGSIPGFLTKKAAQDKAKEIDGDQGRGTFLDPHAGKVSLAEWSHTWFDGLDVEVATESQYECLYRNHIKPRWGAMQLGDITGSAVHAWARDLRARGYAEATVRTTVKILSMMLADAAAERLIPANPIRPARRGRRDPTTIHKEVAWATPEQALRIALQAVALAGPQAGLLLITAAWAGARWGELTGLHRRNTHLDQGYFVIDPDIGALHEVGSVRQLGPPKTAESARTIKLPPFLVDLLRTHLASHDYPPSSSPPKANSCAAATSPAAPCAQPPTAPSPRKTPGGSYSRSCPA